MKFGILLIWLISFLSFDASAQQDAEINVGDTLYFEKCTSTSYTYIDLYKKSRIDHNDTFNYEKLSYWDFYDTFFKYGDFDVTRLPCEYNGRYGIVKHIMAVEIPDTGEVPPPMQTVVIAMIENGKSAAYIIEKAFTEGEVSLAPF